MTEVTSNFITAYPTKRINIDKLQSFLPYSWISSVDQTNLEQGTVTCITLDEDSPEYKKLAEQVVPFHDREGRIYRIRQIDQVENSYVYLMYLTKRHEHYREFISQEHCCFHGTNSNNAPNIVANNLNWRFFGRAVGFVHGQGVYFSKKPLVSAAYAVMHKQNACMLVAKVLVASMAAGNSNTKLPPQFYDTTGTGDDILVKYSDNEFYPEYIVYFSRSAK
ncbi:protein mono-ADP-ribosyltransferase PARP12-like [Neocloeon triangulifer]|uniref:protein mono-ADP-ribosyltransferase PARP12-like n=1 Tax=Neocloeon triangulifer TaxID=2078957 RepID=UPI00286F8469|nr:protein mono-ADP-ribosyltransferase PARP12-like [Neocloeon triangulifer]